MRFANSLLSVGNCPSVYFPIPIASVMRRASSSQPASAATDLNPGLKFPFFFLFYRLAETEKKKVETKKGEQEEKIVTGDKQQGAESCAASCSTSTSISALPCMDRLREELSYVVRAF